MGRRRRRRRRNSIHSTKLNFILLFIWIKPNQTFDKRQEMVVRQKKRRQKKKKQKGVIRNYQWRKCQRRLEELCRRIWRHIKSGSLGFIRNNYEAAAQLTAPPPGCCGWEQPPSVAPCHLKPDPWARMRSQDRTHVCLLLPNPVSRILLFPHQNLCLALFWKNGLLTLKTSLML